MPVLLWVTFWSTMMGAAARCGEVPRPIPAKLPKLASRLTEKKWLSGSHR
jgi:hypothetical protein